MWITCQLQLGRFADASITPHTKNTRKTQTPKHSWSRLHEVHGMEWMKYWFDMWGDMPGRSWLVGTGIAQFAASKSCFDRHERRRERCSCIRKTRQDTSKLRWKCRLKGRCNEDCPKMIIQWNGHVEKRKGKTKDVQNTQTYSEPMSNNFEGVSNQTDEVFSSIPILQPEFGVSRVCGVSFNVAASTAGLRSCFPRTRASLNLCAANHFCRVIC